MTARQRKPRGPAPRSPAGRTEHCQAVGERQVVLVLQGGGALGAYQAGVYEALHEAGTVMHLIRLVAPPLPGEDHTRDLDFSTSGIRTRWQAGLEAARPAIQQRPWQDPVGPVDGLIVHDVGTGGAS